MSEKKYIGVDISDRSIKVLELNRDLEVVAYGRKIIPEGVVTGGIIGDQKVFAESLDEILKETKPNELFSHKDTLEAIVSLPEAKLFVHYLSLPEGLKEKDISEYVRENASKIVPFEFNEVSWAYHVANRNGVQYATFAGTPKKVIDNYVEAFKYANINLSSVGGKLFATGRALLEDADFKDSHIVVDIGAVSTNIGIFDIDKIANFSIQVPIGGELLTKAIAEELSIDMKTAEELKQKHGLTKDSEDPRIGEIIDRSLKDVMAEIGEARDFFEGKFKSKFGNVFLTGGAALLPGLIEYVREKAHIETKVVGTFAKIKNQEVFGGGNNPIFFTDVVGLALLGVDSSLPGFNFLSQSEYIHKNVYTKADVIGKLKQFYIFIKRRRNARDLFKRAREYLSGLTYSKIKVDKKLAFGSVFAVVSIGVLLYVVITYL